MQINNFNIQLDITSIGYIHTIKLPIEGLSLPPTENNILIFVNNNDVDVKSDNFNQLLKPNQMVILNNTQAVLTPPNQTTTVVVIEFACSSENIQVLYNVPQNISFSLKNSLYRVVKESQLVYLPTKAQEISFDLSKRSDYPFGADQLTKSNLEYFLIMNIRAMFLPMSSLSNNARHNANILDSLIISVRNYIDNNPQENFSISTICNLFGTNKSTLCREFKKRVGVTLITYINQCKIQTAKTLIREGKMNFTEISDYLGFASIHYFSKLFTKYENKSPSAYSKRITSYSPPRQKTNL